MSLIRELKHLPVLRCFIKVWSCSNDYRYNKPPQNLVVWNDNIYVVHESVVSVGFACLCSSQCQPRTGVIWMLSTRESGGWSWLWTGMPTCCFHSSWSSSQYGRLSVLRERAKQTLYCLLWPSHRSHVALVFLPSVCPGSHKGLPRFMGRGNRLCLLMGQWEGSRR